jgi:D-aminopeptidase
MRLLVVLIVLAGMQATPPDPRPRARDLGIAPGSMEPGALNAITDVPGVLVGQVTVHSGDQVRTGVTAILPHGGNLFREKVPSANSPARRRSRSSARSNPRSS